jgi:hypothetical protein
MTDSELVALAAKAADLMEHDGEIPVGTPDGQWRPWAPLDNDEDAFRLAVRLNMQIWHRPGGVVCGMTKETNFWNSLNEPLEPDPCAATRRAIVRAAAAIGSAKP